MPSLQSYTAQTQERQHLQIAVFCICHLHQWCILCTPIMTEDMLPFPCIHALEIVATVPVSWGYPSPVSNLLFPFFVCAWPTPQQEWCAQNRHLMLAVSRHQPFLPSAILANICLRWAPPGTNGCLWGRKFCGSGSTIFELLGLLFPVQSIVWWHKGCDRIKHGE